VKNEHILGEISGLKCKTNTIKKRLSGPYEKGIHPLTPGLVSCSGQWYNRYQTL